MAKRIFIVTGEYSGDMHAGKVVEALRRKGLDFEVEAIGGLALKEQGVKLFADHEKMSAMGLTPKIVIDHYILGRKLVNYLKNEYKPDLVLLIDYGTFNLNIAKFLHRAGIKVFYYIPPQVWASRKWRLNTIKKYIDKVLCIFPFEKKMYEEKGISTEYCGHPLASQLPPAAERDAFFEKHGLDKNKKLVSVFPGSRAFELKHLMKVFEDSAKVLQEKHPDLQFCISHAPNLKDKVYNKYLKNTEFKVIKGENHALLSVSDALILASGTVALEASLYTTPMLIAYRGPWFFYLVYLLVRCIKRVSLPNIIADEEIVKEILQGKVSVKNIVAETENLLYNEEYRRHHIGELKKVKALLSDKVSSEEVAAAIVKNFE